MVIVSTEWIGYEEEVKSGSKTLVMANSGTFPSNKNENNGSSDWQQNQSNTRGNATDCARIVLHCQPSSHPFQTRTLFLEPNNEVKVGRSIARSRVSDNNAIFDCKVLSRNHAVLWYSEGKFFVKDTRSSNGTFINDRKIEQSEAEALSSGDIVKFGVDVIENSRKEVHGCIIACVKLFTPDGREFISNNQTRMKSGDGTISLDELHRLHHYIKDASQREKILEVKLQCVQNVIETTRQNTSSCWQAMIDEDKLLNRIDILENKLQFLQKNVPEDRLKNEILKLQQDKFVYQHSAKEALRKVYEERMDALHKLTTIERALCNSEDECSLLRDQLLQTQQNLQEVNCRLNQLEAECKEQKNEQDQNEIDKEENQTLQLKLKEKDDECQEYKSQINALVMEKNSLQKEIEHYEKLYNNQSDNNSTYKKSNSATKSTIMKWFENSDLNQKEGSTEIIEAICSELESKDESCSNKIDLVKLHDKLSSVQNQISSLESGLTVNVEFDEDTTNSTSTPSLSDGNQNIEIKCDGKDLLKSCTLALLDVYKDMNEYISAIKQSNHESAKTEENYNELEEKLNSVQQELADLQLELQKRPSYLQIQEKISLNENLQMEIAALKAKILELDADILVLQNDKVLLEEDLKTANATTKEKNDIALQTSEIIDSAELENKQHADFEDSVKCDFQLLNNTAIEQEEELIAFKEKYQIVTNENIELKNEVNSLKREIGNLQSNFLTKLLTYSVVFIAIFCYLLFSYF